MPAAIRASQASATVNPCTAHAPPAQPAQLNQYDAVLSLTPHYKPESFAGVERSLAVVRFGGGYDFRVPLLAGDHVTDDTGTGFVHTAPSHGREDFDIWTANARAIEARGTASQGAAALSGVQSLPACTHRPKGVVATTPALPVPTYPGGAGGLLRDALLPAALAAELVRRGAVVAPAGAVACASCVRDDAAGAVAPLVT